VPGLEPLEDRTVPSALAWEDHVDLGPFEQAFSAAAQDDQVFVAGFTSAPSGARDFLVRAYDVHTGALRWRSQVKKGSDDFASGVVTDGQSVFVSGNALISGHGYDWVLRAYDANTGALLWENLFDLAGQDDFCRGTAIAVEKDKLFLGGYVTNAQGNLDWMVRAYDTSSGALVWQDQRDVGGLSDGVRALTVKDGRLFVTGWGFTADAERALVRAYDSDSGALLWEKDTLGAADLGGETFGVAIGALGTRVYAAVSVGTAADGQHAVVQAFDETSGDLLWQDPIDKGGEVDFLNALAVHDGRVYAVGYGGPGCLFGVSPPSNCDSLIRTYDAATGALLWERVSDFGRLDDVTWVVAADKGVVYTASMAASHSGWYGQWIVQAREGSTGALRWESLGGANESPVYNMVVHQDRLVVPGRAVNPVTDNWDWIVRAYDLRGGPDGLESSFDGNRTIEASGDGGPITRGTEVPSEEITSAVASRPGPWEAEDGQTARTSRLVKGLTGWALKRPIAFAGTDEPILASPFDR
jgi:glucose dehydrogenase